MDGKRINYINAHQLRTHMGTPITIEELATFCKAKGFVYQSSELYGGMSGFFDFGPYGVELLNNIKASWWKHFVHDQEFMTGMEGSIISHPRVWKASGHLENFNDLALECSKCGSRIRADHLIQESLRLNVEGMPAAKINKIIEEHKLKCLHCKGAFKELKAVSLLFSTKVGSKEDSSAIAYLRGETAQGMFTDFKLIVDTTRQKLPFGIAQIGRCFRNEIAPRDFVFRSREFHIAEFEFFIHPEELKCSLLDDAHKKIIVQLLDAETQAQDKDTLKKTTIGNMVKEKRLDEWHAYWLAEQLQWMYDIGLSADRLKVREHMKTELSHYSSATFDIDYLYPFGSKEIAGNANRGQYDLGQHAKESKEKFSVFDEASKQHVVPRVIEPTFGIERVFLALLVEGYHDDKQRGNIVLKIKPGLAPMKIGVFPLVNKLDEKAREVFNTLRKEFVSTYDRSGSIGRRYARADELGIPFCVTIDFDTLKDQTVTVRDRDTTKQVRISIKDIQNKLHAAMLGAPFDTLGKPIS